MNRKRWALNTVAAGLATTIGLVASGAILSPAAADAPVKVGWWNTGAAPAPDAPAGGMRVAASSQQTLSFGAIQYALPSDASAQLTLNITQSNDPSAQSSGELQPLDKILACPTKNSGWQAGDDQDIANAPAYDCSIHAYVGHVDAASSTGSTAETVTFLIDGSADVTPGVLSLAILPAHSTAIPEVGTDPGTGTDLTPPFVVDIDKPSATSFTPSQSSSLPTTSSAAPPPATTPTGSGVSTSTGSIPAATNITVPAATSANPGQTPVVANPSTNSANTATPTAAAAPATSDNKRNLLWLLLVAVLFGILYTQNMQRAPRQLTPAHAPAAAGGPGDAAGAAAAPAMVAAAIPAYGEPRGLGRFAKPRSGPARPLI